MKFTLGHCKAPTLLIKATANYLNELHKYVGLIMYTFSSRYF